MAKSYVLANRLIGLQMFKEAVWGTVGPATARLMAVKPTPEFTPVTKSTILDEQRHSLIPGFNSYIGMRGGAFTFGGSCTYEEMLALALGFAGGGVLPTAGYTIAIASSTNPTAPALIEITTATPHGLKTGTQVVITGHDNVGANGINIIVVTGPDAFTVGVAGSGGADGTADGTVDVQMRRVLSLTNVVAVPVVLTTATDHGLTTGDQVVITDCQQAPEANGTWKITVTGGAVFSLDGSVGTGVAGSGDYGLVGLAPFSWVWLGPDATPWNPLSYTLEHAYDIATIQAAGAIIQKFAIKGEISKVWEYTASGFYKSHNWAIPLVISVSTDAIPIQVTTLTPHGLLTGNSVLISGHAVNLAANGQWAITYVDAYNFTLDASTGSGAGNGTGGTIELVLTQGLPGRQIEAILFPNTQLYLDPIGGTIGTTLVVPGALQSFDVEIEDGIKEVRGGGSLYPTDFVYDSYKVAVTLTLLLNSATKAIKSGLYEGSGVLVRLAAPSGVKLAQIDYAGVLTADPKEYTDKDGSICFELKLEAIYDSGSLANFFGFTDICNLAVLP